MLTREPELLELVVAEKEIVDLVAEACRKYHADVDPQRILVVVSSKELRAKGCRVAANIRVASPLVNLAFAAGAGLAMDGEGMDRVLDYIICIDAEIWGVADISTRLALLDHELCHIEYSDKDKPKIITHDCEEFIAVVRRHGLWTQALTCIIDAVEVDKQRDTQNNVTSEEVIDG